MKTIQLSQNKQALVDDEDFEELNQSRWFINGSYAYRHASNHRQLIAMHRQIMNCPQGFEVDHLNHDKLDNRKNNLKVCTKQENLLNKSLYKNNKTGVSGIYWLDSIKKYQVRFWIRKIEYYLGCFDSLGDAIEAKQRASVS